MKKILFITSRNIVNTCGELRLIKGRTQALNEKWNIKTDFFAFVNKNKSKRKMEEIGFDSSLKTTYFNKYNIIKQFLLFKNEIIKKIENDKNIGLIIISGVFPMNIAKALKKNFPHLKIVIDIHGANEELIEYKTNNKIKNAIRTVIYKYMQYYLDKTLKYVDGILVVSTALGDYISKTFYESKNKKFYKIPCGSNSNGFSIEKYNELRSKWRKELDINDEILFIYSGGISPWQSIDEVVEVYDYIIKNLKLKSKLLIMSQDYEKLKYLKNNRQDIIIKGFKFEQVQDVLYSGDFAFLLRADTITNNVAFPNKFLEYIQSNMTIICSKFVYDLKDIVEDYQIGILYDKCDGDLTKNVSEFINIRKSNLIDNAKCTKINAIIGDSNYQNTLQNLVNDFLKI
jgi:hypothetical protein